MWNEIVFLIVSFVAIAASLTIRNSVEQPLDSKEIYPSARIVGGYEALDEQFPYQAGLLVKTVNGSAWCGGSLIDRRWVLTAAHCLYKTDNITVYLGTNRLFGIDEVGTQIIHVTSEDFFVHEAYDEGWKRNDLGLIRLPVNARISRDIKIISLPDSVDVDDSFEGVIAIASGWGRLSDYIPSVTETLRFVELEVISNYACSLYFGTLLVQGGNICTSGMQFKSPCSGDSGGPLVYEKDKKKILIGIVSFGSSSGCEEEFPAVFVRVTYYLKWIKTTMGQ